MIFDEKYAIEYNAPDIYTRQTLLSKLDSLERIYHTVEAIERDEPVDGLAH